MSFSGAKAARTACFFLLVFFVLSPHLNAGEISIESRVGFHGLFHLGYPFPLEITINNSGRPVEGSLEVEVWKGGPGKDVNPYPFYYQQSLFVPGQASKCIQLTVDPDLLSRPLKIAFSGLGVLVSHEIDLRRYFSPSPLLLLLTESQAPPSIVSGSNLPNPIVPLSLSELPSDPRALLGVTTIILYEQSLRDLFRSQLFALENWLTGGGRIVVLGSLNYALYQEPNIQRFLPVRITGARKLSSLTSLHHRYGGGASSVGAVWVQESKAEAGKTLIEEQGLPILVEKMHGKGKIFYLAMDVGRPPLSSWHGSRLLVRSLLSFSREKELSSRATWDDWVFDRLSRKPSFLSSYAPTGSFLLALSAYLLCLRFFPWLWRRERLPRRTLVFSFIAFTVASALAGYVYFSRSSTLPEGVLLSATLLESATDGYAVAQSNLALFSTKSRNCRVRAEPGWSDWVLVPSPVQDGEGASVTLREAGGSSYFLFHLKKWNYRLFKMRFIEKFPVRVEFETRGNNIRVQVHNDSAQDLIDCRLISLHRQLELRDIPHNSHWETEFSLSSNDRSRGRSSSSGLRDVTFKDKTRTILFRHSFFAQEFKESSLGSEAVVFCGWLNKPIRKVWSDDWVQVYDYTLFRAVRPLAGEEDG